jgi:hypothetical protein|tara:strand:+ start:122 stop:679 length:558 start_codon:yes stop_codon:yes gene_type:complete
MAALTKIVKGALSKLSDAPVDKSKRKFIKKAVAVPAAAGSAAVLGGAGILGTEAIKAGKKSLGELFASGKLDNIVSKVKKAFDEDWADSTLDDLQKNLNYNDNQLMKVSEDVDFLYDMAAPEDPFKTASEIKDFTDDIMGEMVYGGDNPAFLIGEFKKPVFKSEVLEQFPDVNIDELNSLTDKLF